MFASLTNSINSKFGLIRWSTFVTMLQEKNPRRPSRAVPPAKPICPSDGYFPASSFSLCHFFRQDKVLRSFKSTSDSSRVCTGSLPRDSAFFSVTWSRLPQKIHQAKQHCKTTRTWAKISSDVKIWKRLLQRLKDCNMPALFDDQAVGSDYYYCRR